MSENEDETLAISDKVEILSTEDEKIKAVGEILSSDSSRKILKLLFNQSLTANQISQKIGVSLPLVIYHLKKMQESDVIKITNVGKNTKSHDMKFYTVDKFAIVILPSEISRTTTITTGEPSFDILWSLVIVLLVVVAGLIIELVIKNKKSQTTKLS